MPVTSSISFTYNGISSDTMGIINVNTQDNGLFQDVLVGDRAMKEIIVRHRPKPYFQRIQDTPITLTLRLSFADPFDKDSIRNVVSWLCGNPQYQEMSFSDNPDKIFYAMYIGTNPQLQHDGNGNGYMTLTMRCDAPYAYSASTTDNFDFSTSGSGNIPFSNLGDFSLYPELEITKFGNNNGDIIITNTSNGGQQFILQSAKQGTGTLSIAANIVDGMTVQIGRDVYEFDTDGYTNPINIRVSVPPTDLSALTALNMLVNTINTTTSKVENVTATAPVPTIISGSTNTTGTTQYNYQVVALDANNNALSTSNVFAVSSGATLSTTDTNTITWLVTTSASQYAIYRTVNSTTSLVCLQAFNANVCTWTDTGTAPVTPPNGVPSTPPSPSTTSTTFTVTDNVMGDKMPVGTNFPSVLLWSTDYIDGSGILDQEVVYFDNENQIIISSLTNTYRFDAFNGNYLEMVTGMNYLTVQGYCKLQFRWRNLLIQG